VGSSDVSVELFLTLGDLAPIAHIDVIHVLGQRMPIIAPLDATNPTSKDVSAIGFIHPKHVVSYWLKNQSLQAPSTAYKCHILALVLDSCKIANQLH
jgi:hypothetical protein